MAGQVGVATFSLGDEVVVCGLGAKRGELNGARGHVKGFVDSNTVAVSLAPCGGGADAAPRTVGLKRKNLLSVVQACGTAALAAAEVPFFTPRAPPPLPEGPQEGEEAGKEGQESKARPEGGAGVRQQQQGRAYSPGMERSTHTCRPPAGCLRRGYVGGEVSDVEGGGALRSSYSMRWQARTVSHAAFRRAVPLEWVCHMVVQEYIVQNEQQFSLVSDQLFSIVRLDSDAPPGKAYSFAPPVANLPSEVKGLMPQAPPDGVLSRPDIPKYGLMVNKMQRKVGATPKGVFGMLRGFVEACRAEERAEALRNLSVEALEELFFRITLRFASPSLCVCMLHCLSLLSSKGWARVSCGGHGDAREELPIDMFRVHVAHQRAPPAALHYIVSEYGPPDFYRTVELLEDAQGGTLQHHVLVNSGRVLDVCAAARGLPGHRSPEMLPRWTDYDEHSGSRIHPVCERPESLAEVKSKFDDHVTRVVDSFALLLW